MRKIRHCQRHLLASGLSGRKPQQFPNELRQFSWDLFLLDLASRTSDSHGRSVRFPALVPLKLSNSTRWI